MNIYPWQQAQWQQLEKALQAGRLPHALLFTGIAGTGKALFADLFANALLCTAGKDAACGECHACRMIAGNAHPNKITIAPEKAGAAIKVDQIREISEFTQQTALIGSRRIVIIQQADNMNNSAANALLKTLEEPSAGALLILISDQVGQLPATILSRCQRIIFPRPRKEIALQWLQTQLKTNSNIELLLNIAHGAPLRALQFADEESLAPRKKLYDALCQHAQINPVALAAELGEIELLMLIDYFLSFLIDVLRLKLGADKALSTDYQQQLNALHTKITAGRCVGFMEHLQSLRHQILAGINFNKQLAVEAMLIRWQEMTA